MSTLASGLLGDPVAAIGAQDRDRGLEDDVACAGAVDVSECVPVLGADGGYRAARQT